MVNRGMFVIIVSFLLLQAQALEQRVKRLPMPDTYHYLERADKLFTPQRETLLEAKRYESQWSFKASLPVNYQKTYEDLVYLQLLSFTALLGIWFLPQDQSQWDHSEIEKRNPLKSWYDNVKDGPVYDEDKWWINYIGHSVVGAYYYTWARTNGLSAWESSVFNFLMSTFYWEYGVEAMFERPSKQDIIITPVLGSLLGEGFYQLHLMIVKNDGKVLGSKGLGAFFMTLLNPEGALADFLRLKKDRVKMQWVNYFPFYNKIYSLEPLQISEEPIWMESYLGLRITIKF